MISLGLGLLVVGGLSVPAVAWAVGRALRWPGPGAIGSGASAAIGGPGGGAQGRPAREAIEGTFEPERPSGVAWPRLVIGAVAFIGASLVQNILVAPVALLIHGPHGLQPLIPTSVAEALYYGFAAGLAQEGAKLAGIQLYQRRGAIAPTAIAVGAGFALIEILFVSLTAFGTPLNDLQALVVPVWERGSAIAFHIGAALIIAAGLLRGHPWRYLAAAIVLHGILDGTVGLMAYADVHPIVAFETANLVFSLAVLAVGMRLVRRQDDEPRR